MQTAKKKWVTIIPELRTRIYIPNRLVNARYSYTVIQERIFNYVMFYLQGQIKQIREGKSVTQLDIFNVVDNNINISVPLIQIAKPACYGDVRAAAKELAAITVMIEKADATGKVWVLYQGLFHYVGMPKERERSGSLIIKVGFDVAEMLISIDKKPDGSPKNFTTYEWEICMRAKNKYTARIYKLISSWKRVGIYDVSMAELREILGLKDKYQDYSQFKNRVLMPVQKELQNTADIWFDCNDDLFCKKEGKKVVGLHFKIIDQDQSLHYVKQRDYIIYLLKTHFKITDAGITMLSTVLDVTNGKMFTDIIYKIAELHTKTHNDKTIKNVAGYAIKSLINLYSAK